MPVTKSSFPAFQEKSGKTQDSIFRYQTAMTAMAALISMMLNIRMAISTLTPGFMH